MADPFTCDDQLHQLDAEIAAAWQELNRGRAVANRSASGDNLAAEITAEATLNELLEKRHELKRNQPAPLAY